MDWLFFLGVMGAYSVIVILGVILERAYYEYRDRDYTSTTFFMGRYIVPIKGDEDD